MSSGPATHIVHTALNVPPDAILASIPDPAWIADPSSRILAANRHVCEWLGLPEDRVVGRRIADLLPRDLAERLLREDREVIDRGEKRSFEEEVPDGSGGASWIHIVKSPLRNAAGEVVGLFGIFRDETTIKRAVNAQRASLQFFSALDRLTLVFTQARNVEELVRAAMETILDLFQCDRAWLLYPCDPQADRWRVVFESTRPEYPGALAMNLEFPVEDSVATVFRDALASYAPVEYGQKRPHPWFAAEQYDIRSQMDIALRPRLGPAWLLGLHQCSRGRAWTHDEQRLFGAIAARLTDALTNLLVTRDLQTSVQSLRESEENFRAMAENALAGILLFSRGKLVYANPDALEMSGYSADELATRTIADLVDDDVRSAAALETTLTRKDGRRVPVEIARATSLWHGAAAELVFLRDITARRRVEDERRDLLEREQRARADAERASRAKDAFLGIVSHELRTPLTSILAWAQILKQGRSDQRTTLRAAEAIERGARAQSQLIDDLLDMTRIVAGRLSMELRLVDPLPVILAAVDSIRPLADAKSIDLVVEASATGARIRGEPLRLQQVLWNLLVNAIKFTPDHGRVVVQFHVDTANECRFVVKDDGRGISADFLPHLFDPFAQADTSSTRSHRGLGLGLAIVRSLVERHGGRVWAESEGEGKGASFTITLPIAEHAEESTPSGSPIAQATLPLLSGRRILVVEDDAETRGVLDALLGAFGADVRTAGSAAEALTTWPAFQPEALVSDLAMPGDDGFALIKRVRAVDAVHGEHTPAVALSAFAAHEDMNRARTAGFDAFLAKPVDAQAIARTILALLGHAGGGRSRKVEVSV